MRIRQWIEVGWGGWEEGGGSVRVGHEDGDSDEVRMELDVSLGARHLGTPLD